MKNITNNIKITTYIIVIMIVSLIAIIGVGVMGYYGVGTVNDNVANMYEDALIPIQQANDLANKVMLLRIEMMRLSELGYSSSIANSISSLDVEVREMIEAYEIVDEESNHYLMFSIFQRNYDGFMKFFDDFRDRLFNGEEATPEDKLRLTTQGNQMITNLSMVIDYNRTAAEELSINSNNIFNKTRNDMLGVFAGAGIVILLFCLFLITNIKKAIKETINDYETISNGDFSIEIEANGKNEFNVMRKSLGNTIGTIATMLTEVKGRSFKVNQHCQELATVSEQMASSSEEVAITIQEIAKGSVTQTEELNNINHIIVPFNDKLQKMVSSINEVNSYTQKTDTMVSDGNETLQDLVESINKFNELFIEVREKVNEFSGSMNNIKSITVLIKNISDQTNLLALNAAIEAARVGEAGKGFAVVANEIRSLAEETKIASEDINQLLVTLSASNTDIINSTSEIQADTENQTKALQNMLESFGIISQQISGILPKVNEISKSILEINEDKDIVIAKVNDVINIAEGTSASAQQISASSEEMSAASHEVALTAQSLKELMDSMESEVNKFKL
ncbi:methyl-accepting chemotaxis protein [Alkaliphilus peptidifermentans]|uniref:Methyl-accepting chemotaxis protein n=1 Tax=Alkaliphilus peptidifermentans DSM 18978 TaxID=1120976 RepID=A0A1G5J0V3_9FIRM|nr:methyl-accepting chemotaxis protein [Alkaliphilus peptidifermentans]SCY81985.1 methyl-accepting chemotaxis protein [Alkaliphilus peptidifermentans DSM 18978]